MWRIKTCNDFRSTSLPPSFHPSHIKQTEVHVTSVETIECETQHEHCILKSRCSLRHGVISLSRLADVQFNTPWKSNLQWECHFHFLFGLILETGIHTEWKIPVGKVYERCLRVQDGSFCLDDKVSVEQKQRTKREMWPQRGSNPWPHHSESRALPIAPHSNYVFCKRHAAQIRTKSGQP